MQLKTYTNLSHRNNYNTNNHPAIDNQLITHEVLTNLGGDRMGIEILNSGKKIG